MKLIALLSLMVLYGCTTQPKEAGTPEEAVRVYYAAWATKDSIALASVLVSKDSASLHGRFLSLFEHNPNRVELLDVIRTKIEADSIAFVDALISIQGGPSSDTVKLILRRTAGWKVIFQSSPWQTLDRY